jgi:predicted ATP-grasp superfamily ATP-dependent carboligase
VRKTSGVFKKDSNKLEGKILDPVIVLGGGLTGLGLARVLGRRGIDIYLVVDKKDEVIFSKYCRKTFIASRMRCRQKVLKNLLKTIGRSLGRRAVVYPTSDLDALNLSELKEDLPDDYHFVVGDKEPVEILVNKSKFYRELDRHRIDYPVTFFPEGLEDVRRIGARLTYPVFIRPAISQLFNKIFSTEGKGFFANSLRELTDYYQLATRFGVEVMFQEIIPGPPSNSYQFEGYYNMQYRPTVLFARQRLRIWPPDFGNTTLCVSIPLTKLGDKKNEINDFIHKIGYQGLMSAEFKKDARDGRLKFLEVNARAWWHFWLSAECGADIIFSSYLDAIGEKTEYIEDYETGLKSIYLLPDLMASASMFINGNLGFPEWVRSMYGITKSTVCPREDLSPFIMSFANNLLVLKRQMRHFRRDIRKT